MYGFRHQGRPFLLLLRSLHIRPVSEGQLRTDARSPQNLQVLPNGLKLAGRSAAKTQKPIVSPNSWNFSFDYPSTR